ncbi:hypothetical protein L2Z53_11880 (plasmid) [Macrococcoides canis]|uniref:hypothetical protein n=1 Tax=Macrococcoides canis TaxID=1855823 RepID=UPI001F2739A9|nr:hypothetical protein [Macrococcus canis]UJS29034.1 hypothetical protein L2Z53_11880 [Macrococcus canis]
MGLDMFLEYIDDGDVNVKTNSESSLNEAVYWRKSNMIHNWFEQNVAEGDIEPYTNYEVTIEQIKELKRLLEKVIKKPEDASKLLPTLAGFFFGNTEYNTIYFMHIKYSIEELETVINNHKNNRNYFYSASW